MKINTLLLFCIGLGLTSCFDNPDFPDTPRIEFQDLQFKEASGADSLIIFLKFEDGDGDLGLGDEFTSGDFRQGDFFSDQNGNIITIEHAENPDYNLPPYEPPFECVNWKVETTFENFCSLSNIPSEQCDDVINGLGVEVLVNQDAKIILDTLYYEPNPNYENMELTFFYKVDDSETDFDLEDEEGKFKEFDWVTGIPGQRCSFGPSLRFPVLSDASDSSPLEGTIKYAYTSSGLLPLFENETLKLRTRIKDRALNESNVIVTPAFTLRGIQTN